MPRTTGHSADAGHYLVLGFDKSIVPSRRCPLPAGDDADVTPPRLRPSWPAPGFSPCRPPSAAVSALPPRAAVLPLPEPLPRPPRLCFLREPALSAISLIFIARFLILGTSSCPKSVFHFLGSFSHLF